MKTKKTYKTFFVIMTVIAVISSFSALIVPFLISYWSRYDIDIDFTRLLILISILVGAFLLNVILIFIREKFARNFNVRNALEFLKKVLGLKYDTILKEGSVKLLERSIQMVNNVYSYMTGDAVYIISNAITAFVILIFVFFDSYVIALILLFLLPINYLGFVLINSRLYVKSQTLQENSAKSFQELTSVISQVDYLKQCSNTSSIYKNLKPSIESLYGAMAEVNAFAQTSSNGITALNSLLQTICLILVSYRYLQGNANSFVIIIYTLLLPRYFSCVSAITNMNLHKNNFNVSKEFFKFLEQEQEISCQESVHISAVDTIEFNIKDIPLNDSEKSCIKPISMVFNKGDIVQVAGENGSGKSSLMKLLVKFRESDGIKINNIPLSKISYENIRNLVTYIPQVSSVVNGTLRDSLFLNIPYSSELEKKYEALPLLHSLLATKNMDTEILDMGANLSGGEKQRISLARALCSHCDCLILDEITANIDIDSTKDILKSVKAMSDNMIVFIITHDDLPAGYANKTLILEKADD